MGGFTPFRCPDCRGEAWTHSGTLGKKTTYAGFFYSPDDMETPWIYHGQRDWWSRKLLGWEKYDVIDTSESSNSSNQIVKGAPRSVGMVQSKVAGTKLSPENSGIPDVKIT